MAATRGQIRAWLGRAYADETVTHMIVKCDTFDMASGDCCYPVYVNKGESALDVATKNQDRTMEVYAMHHSMDDQLAESRAFHYESAEEVEDDDDSE